MFSLSSKGGWDKTEAWLKKMSNGDIFSKLEGYGQEGVNALQAATPVESGQTASSWYYEILQESGSWSIVWGNSHSEGGSVIAILLQYGHGTGTGGYVQGRDFINPALRPVFDRISNEAWKAVTQP